MKEGADKIDLITKIKSFECLIWFQIHVYSTIFVVLMSHLLCGTCFSDKLHVFDTYMAGHYNMDFSVLEIVV